MVTKSELLKKFSSAQLKEIAVCEKIKIPKGARKATLIEKLVPIPMVSIKKYAQEYSADEHKSTKTKSYIKEKKLSAYQRGHELEKRTAAWLRKQFGFKTKLNDLVNGKIVKRPYEVDVHAIKKSLFGDKHIWVECKALKVKRTHVSKLVSNAEDVKEANWDDSKKSWNPAILLMVSDIGYDTDALSWANKKKVFCAHVDDRSFTFVGKRSRNDFEDEF